MSHLRSISDDDLCSDCQHCTYEPGDMSECALDWPGVQNPDGYVVSCESFDPASKLKPSLEGA